MNEKEQRILPEFNLDNPLEERYGTFLRKDDFVGGKKVKIVDVYSMPNPFKKATDIMFTVEGDVDGHLRTNPPLREHCSKKFGKVPRSWIGKTLFISVAQKDFDIKGEIKQGYEWVILEK